MSTRNFKKVATLFLDSISTFKTYELFRYHTLIFYTVLASIISLDIVSLKQKVVDAPEILTVIGKITYLPEFLNSPFFSIWEALHCTIDKVAGVLETNRPDSENALYRATIKQGDFLLNRIKKLSRVIDL
ncbi:hypothetical protein Tsubulata_020848 [Turnera subulata]|uniref:Uncharacterized protein n=1 Tax=Turnera subulata TaxID=218843 RepID=A0A9Q0G713_9ROSI|nr:hypothetical protein Tsubulata_020848 [Turnera subulata]